MKQISYFTLTGFAITILLISNCGVCHGKSANVDQVKRLTDDESSAQLHHNYKVLNEANADQKAINAFKDRYNSDKIVFDRGDLYPINKDQTTIASTATSNDLPSVNKIIHQYSGKENGEYVFSLSIRNGIRHIESGEFEEQNGQTVFIVRGFFEQITKEGDVKVTAYVFDHTGYHEIPVINDSEGDIYLSGPEQTECDYSKGVYCIDRKLLSLMVG